MANERMNADAEARNWLGTWVDLDSPGAEIMAHELRCIAWALLSVADAVRSLRPDDGEGSG
jgi:hypothetical protein